jgi:hypothetical protein
MIMIIQLNLHRGFSVTDYIKYYAYLYYLLSLDYLFLQQLWYYFPNYSMFILTHHDNFPCGRKPERPEKTNDFRQSVDKLFSHAWVHTCMWKARIEPMISEVKVACSDDCATEARVDTLHRRCVLENSYI